MLLLYRTTSIGVLSVRLRVALEPSREWRGFRSGICCAWRAWRVPSTAPRDGELQSGLEFYDGLPSWFGGVVGGGV